MSWMMVLQWFVMGLAGGFGFAIAQRVLR